MLAEAQGLEVLTVLPPYLDGKQQKVGEIIDDLNRSDQTYRRLAAVRAFSYAAGEKAMTAELTQALIQLGAA